MSGLESLDNTDVDWLYIADDEFSGSFDETSVTDTSSVSVAFHCYHSLPSAEWADNVQVRNNRN